MSPQKATPLIRHASPAILLVVCVLTYWNALGNGFTYDDHYVVASNELVRTVDPVAIFSAPFWRGFATEGSGTYYRPVTILSYAVDHHLHGLDPTGYHATNVAFHTLTVLLVYLFARRLIRSDRAALAAGLLFAVHPVLTEAVASVSGRSDILVTLFSLAALLCHLSRRKTVKAMTWLPTFLAVCSKEIGVVLPLLLVLTDVVWPREREAGTMLRLRSLVRTHLSTAGVIAAFVWLRWSAVGNLAPVLPSPMDNPLVEHGLVTSLFTLPVILLHYARLLLFPASLSVDYGFNQIPVLDGPSAALFVVLALCGMVWHYRDRILNSPTAIVSASIIAVPVLVTANPFLNAGSILSERYLYLPTVGLVVLLAASAHKFRPVRLTDRSRRLAGWAVLMVLVVTGAVRTTDRNADWASDERLFAAAVVESPNSVRAHLNYAEILSSRGDHVSASRHYEHVLALKSDYPIVNYKLAKSLQLSGQPERALHFYAATTRLRPDDANAWSGMAAVSMGMGRDAEAERALKRAISLAPGKPSLYNQLGVVYQRRGLHAEALQAYERALAGDYHHPGVYCNLGIIYKEQGEHLRARKAFDTALRIDPEMTLVHYHLGALEQETGNPVRAISHYETFLSGWDEDEAVVKQVRETVRVLKQTS